MANGVEQDDISKQFEPLRARARREATKATQQEQEGLKRRFAALGQGSSGAAIRAQALAERAGSERLQAAQEGIGFQEQAARTQAKQIGEQREFQRAEREAGQQFQAGILGKQQEFQKGLIGQQQEFARGERAGAQEFASAEAGKARGFSAEQANLARSLQEKSLGLQQKALDAQIQQFDQEFARDSGTLDFNKKMQEAEAGKGIFGDLLGDFNFGNGNIDFSQLNPKDFASGSTVAAKVYKKPINKAIKSIKSIF